jgi:hypothetical protein
MEIIRKIVVTMVIALLLASGAAGIEKKKKEATPSKDTTKLVEPKALQSSSKAPATKATDSTHPFNDFVDLNKNGIDDRLEKSKPGVTDKRLQPMPPAVKKPELTKKPEVTKTPAAKDTAKKESKKKS